MKCTNCGSHAINPHLHGRDKTRLDLCDVCFWRNKAEGLNLTKPNAGDIVYALNPNTGEQFKDTVVNYNE